MLIHSLGEMFFSNFEKLGPMVCFWIQLVQSNRIFLGGQSDPSYVPRISKSFYRDIYIYIYIYENKCVYMYKSVNMHETSYMFYTKYMYRTSFFTGRML